MILWRIKIHLINLPIFPTMIRYKIEIKKILIDNISQDLKILHFR
jgi:hypothetical protein